MYPTTISGIEPKIINDNNFWLCFRLINSFLKKNMIAIKDPRCKLTSIISELDLNSYNVETTTKWADELIGKNSETPCIRDRITISIIFVSIFFGNLNSTQIKQFHDNMIGMHN